MFQLEFLIGFAAFIATVLGIGYTIGRWTKTIDARLKDVEGATSLLIYLHLDRILELYRKFFPLSSNPQEVEKERLLSKLREGTLTPQEADKLRELLERQRADALMKGLIGGAIVIGGLLLLLAFLSVLVGEKKT
jgi:1-deoxy-D-xylulose 5-phosphate reductoisomerase